MSVKIRIKVMVGQRWREPCGICFTVERICQVGSGRLDQHVDVVTDAGSRVTWEIARFLPNAVGGSFIYLSGSTGSAVPAPPESRWLDPASVPVGATELSACQLEGDEHTRCFYPSKPGHKVCPACKDKCSRNDTRGTPVLPPSVLTPVPRWRSLTGTKWSCGKPERVGEIYRVQNAFPAASGLNARWAPFARKPKTPRVYRVRAHDDRPGRDPSLLAEKWVRA